MARTRSLSNLKREALRLAVALANPKSMSFAPVLVSMMLPGFRSRWTTPRLVGFLQTLRRFRFAYFSNCSGGKRPLPQTIGQSLAFEKFHDQDNRLHPGGRHRERADIGMIQRRDGARFAIEALLWLRGFRTDEKAES